MNSCLLTGTRSSYPQRNLVASTYEPVVVSPIFVVFYLLLVVVKSHFHPLAEVTFVVRSDCWRILRSSTYNPVVVSPIFVDFYLLTGRCESSVLPFVESTLVLILVDDGYCYVVFCLLTGRCNPLFAVVSSQFAVLRFFSPLDTCLDQAVLSPLGLPLPLGICSELATLSLLIGHLCIPSPGTPMPFFSVDYSFNNLQPGYG